MGTVATGARVGAPIRRRESLSEWLEGKGAAVAFVCAAVAMIARGALMYSGGSFNMAALFGARVVWFNIVFGLGLSVGCELSSSIAGRSWQAWSAEAQEAAEARGLTKAARAVRVRSFSRRALMMALWMLFFMLVSAAAAAFYAIVATGAHGLALAGEVTVAVVLVAVVNFLSVFNIPVPQAGRELARTAHDIRMAIIASAGERIRRGDHSPQDVRIYAGALPRADGARFQSAFLTETADNPLWGSREVARLFGSETDAAIRKMVSRRLKAIADAGGPVTKSATNAYQITRRDALEHFADELLSRLAPPDVAATLARPRERSHSGPLAPDSDSDSRATGPAQPRDSRADGVGASAAAVAG